MSTGNGKRPKGRKSAGSKRKTRKAVARKTTAPTETQASATSTAVELVEQPHGGALNSGGTPGNAGGTGRPPSVVRMRSRSAYYDRIPQLEKIADNEKGATDADRIRAINVLGTIGMAGAISTDDVRESLRGTLADIRDELEPDVAERLIARIRRRWRGDE